MEQLVQSDVYLCSECNIQFSFEITFTKHLEISHKGSETLKKVITCKVCLKRFSTQHSLKFHRAKIHADYTHYKIRKTKRGVPSTCYICGITVRYLEAHMETKHINPDKNKKICPKCDYVGPSGCLRRHFENKHTTDKIETCPFCAEV